MISQRRNPILNGHPPHPLLVVLSGPSGVGKDAALMRMRELGFPFHFVVTATSRPIRPGERNGFDYHFLRHEQFEALIAQEELLEWAEVYGHYKGIPKSEVRQAFTSGKDVILRIDVQGAATIRRLAPDAVFIFIAPGSFHELETRLVLRRTEDPDQLERRLSVARLELDQVDVFDYIVINHEDKLDETVGSIRNIIDAENIACLRARFRYSTLRFVAACWRDAHIHAQHSSSHGLWHDNGHPHIWVRVRYTVEHEPKKVLVPRSKHDSLFLLQYKQYTSFAYALA